MEKRLAITTKPTVEPVDAAYVKLHARIDIVDDDDWINQRITAARAWAEKFTGKTFGRTGYVLKCPAWKDDGEDFLLLPKGPALTLDTVAYRGASDGVLVQHDEQEFEIETDETLTSRLRFKYGKTIPSVANAWDAVQITYVAGAETGSEDEIDERVRQCIAMVVAYWYENRESTHMDVPESIQSSARGLLWDLVATDC